MASSHLLMASQCLRRTQIKRPSIITVRVKKLYSHTNMLHTSKLGKSQLLYCGYTGLTEDEGVQERGHYKDHIKHRITV